jgi:gas vesicle protein
MTKGKFALGALIGAAAGFVAGILTAPKSGKETREDIKTVANDAKDKAVKKAGQVRKKAGDVAENVVDRAGKVAGDVADKVADGADDFKARSKTVSRDAKAAIRKNK